MNSSKPSSDFAPLLQALQQMEQRLELKGVSRILVAAADVKEFKRQELASHNKIKSHRIVGARVPVQGRYRTDQVRTILAHWPEDHLLEAAVPTLLFVLSGQADIRVANYSVCCWPGDIVLIPAGVPKSDGSVPDYANITPEAFCDIMMFSPGLVYGQGLECSIGHSRGDKHIAPDIDEGCWVKNFLLAQLYTGLNNELQNKGNSRSTYHLLLLLLILLRREVKEGNAIKGWQFLPFPVHPVKQTLIRQAMEYIHNHLEEPLAIDVVARQIGISRTAFTRDFRRETGDTFKNYLTTQRLNYAEVLLREANLPVKRVSALVGLSPGRLRYLFQQKHQCTPDEFRNASEKCP